MQYHLSYLRVLSVFFLFQLLVISQGFAFTTSVADTTAGNTSSQKYGFLKFEIEPDTLYLYLNNDYNNLITITDGTKIKVRSGVQRLHIFGNEISDEDRNLILAEGETHLISLEKHRLRRNDKVNTMYAAYRWNANLMLFSDEDTEISVLHTEHYSPGFLKAKLSPGAYRVQFKSASGKVTERFVEVNNYDLKTEEIYFKPRKSIAVMAGIIPGGSQLYKRQTGKAALAFAGFGISTGLAIHYNQQMASESRMFNTVLAKYQDATVEQDAFELGNQLDLLAGSIDNNTRNRNIFRATAIVLYIASFVDTFREPQMGFARKRAFDPYRDFSIDMQSDSVVAKLQLRF